jgi:branched-chain amino acid transport system substrate-binding protein
MKKIVLLCMMVLLALVWSGEAASEWKGEIKIGCTNMSAPFSYYTRDGANIAVEEINKAGGVLGRKLVFIFRDNKGVSETAVSQAKELCVRNKIHFAIGCVRSSCAKAVSSTYHKYKIPALHIGAMSEEIMEPYNPYYMRICNPNSVCGSCMASVVKKGNYKRPSILYINDAFGMNLRKIMHEQIEALGMKVVSEASMDLGTPDLSPQAMKISGEKPDVILLILHPGDAGNAIRTWRGMGYKGDFVAYSAISMNPTRASGGHTVDGTIFPTGGQVQGFYIWNRPGGMALLLTLQEKHPEEKYELLNAPPEVEVLYGYDSIYLFKQWIELAGERGLKDKDYFMDVVAKSKVHTVASDVCFPYGRKNMESVALQDLHLRQYVNGHTRVWKHDPRCIETFEATRIQAEEEVYSKGFTKGVTYRKFLARWQELLRENEAKVHAEIEEKLEKGIISTDYAWMFKKALAEILAYEFF